MVVSFEAPISALQGLGFRALGYPLRKSRLRKPRYSTCVTCYSMLSAGLSMSCSVLMALHIVGMSWQSGFALALRNA